MTRTVWKDPAKRDLLTKTEISNEARHGVALPVKTDYTCYDIELEKDCTPDKHNQFSDLCDMAGNNSMIQKGNLKFYQPSKLSEWENDSEPKSEYCSENFQYTKLAGIVASNKSSSKSSNEEITTGRKLLLKGGYVNQESDGRKRHRSDDVKKGTGGQGIVIDHTSSDAWKRSKIDSVKKETFSQDKTRDSYSNDAGKGHSIRDDVNRDSVQWDGGPEYASNTASKQSNRYSNVNRDSDGWGMLVDKTASDSWNFSNKDSSVYRETGEGVTTSKLTDPFTLKKNYSTSGNFGKETSECGRALDNRDRSPRKQHDIGLEDNKEKDAWGTTIKKTGPDPWNCHSRGSNVHKETDRVDTTIELTKPHPWKKDETDVNAKKESRGLVQDLNNGGLERWNRRDRNSTANKELGGQGLTLEQTGRGPWKHHVRDGNHKIETEGWRKYADNTTARTDGSKAREHCTKKDGSDAWNTQSGGNVNSESSGWVTAAKKDDFEAWEHCSKNNGSVALTKRNGGNANSEPSEWHKAVEDSSEADAWKKHNRNGNVNNEYKEWGASSKKDGSDAWKCGDKKEGSGAWKKHNGDYNAITESNSIAAKNDDYDAWDRCIKKDGSVAWKKQNIDGNCSRESNEWGTSGKKNGSDAWKKHTGDCNVDTESNRTAVKKDSSDPWERCIKKDGFDTWKQQNIDGNCNRGSSGWGTWSKDGSDEREHCSKKDGSDAWGKCNRETDGRSTTVKHATPDAWERSSDAWNRDSKGVDSQSEKDPWEKALSQKGPNLCKKDGWGAAIDQNGLDVWKQHNSDSKGVDSQRELNGWGTAIDQNNLDVWKQQNKSTSPRRGWNRSRRSRSRSPPIGSKYGFEGRDDRGRREMGALAGVCKHFSTGRCRRGNQCNYLHDDNHPKHFGGATTETISRYEDLGSGREKLTSSGDEKYSYQDRVSHKRRGRSGSQDRHEPGRASRTNAYCFHFSRGRCYRGSHCKFIHEAPNSSRSESRIWEDKPPCDQRDSINPSCNDPSWGDLTASANASSSPHWMSGDGTSVAVTCSMGTEHSTQLPKAQSVTSNLEDRSQVREGSKIEGCFPGVKYSQTDSRVGLRPQMYSDRSGVCSSAPAGASLSQPPQACWSSEQHGRQLVTGHHDEHSNNKGKEKQQNRNLEGKQDELREFTRREKETGTGSSKKEHTSQATGVDADNDEGHNVNRDDRELKNFKFALASFVKDVLKPTWMDGHLSKEAHKIIVKKVIDKVIKVLPGNNIPRTDEHIKQYISFSRVKLITLVQAYLDLYTKASHTQGKGKSIVSVP